MSSSKSYVRDLQQEIKTAKARGERGGSDSADAKRHRARRAALKTGKVKPGQDLDHKVPLSKGGSNKPSNTRAKSPSANRSFPRNSKGGIK
jgi:hypothetical protein